ncbi:MAG TPA: hypothetical protein VOA88_11020 [Candidatus Dormibacteraeota bacterium]|nr:hypothetical protein [Candidatus Dormibacteraeota bacterium]
MIDGLAGIKSGKGTVVFVCSKCRVVPDNALGAQNKGELVYMLICSKCGAALAEWDTIEAREKELREFAKKVELLA